MPAGLLVSLSWPQTDRQGAPMFGRLQNMRRTSGGIKMPNGNGTSRRSFLKLSGAAALLSSVDRGTEASDDPRARNAGQSGSPRTPANGAARLVDWVNPLQGTD